MKLALALIATIALTVPSHAATVRGFSVDVVSGGRTLPELHGRGSVYVEALIDRSYELRITNPLPVRVAVALAVDGRNTIDARRTSSWEASKWVLQPYETIVVSGWQISGETARLFTFTTERRSYAAWLGDTTNLGVIEAVFYEEKDPHPCIWCEKHVLPDSRKDNRSSQSAPAPSAAGALESGQPAPGEFAATGMGEATANPVTRVAIDLERRPVGKVRIRYEFHDQLVALGLLPRYDDRPPARRERARGFSEYCPQP